MNQKLKAARVTRCFSEKDVCQAIGADIRSYQRWEHGQTVPQPYYRKRLCDFFGMTLEELGYDALTLVFSDFSVVQSRSLLVPGVGQAEPVSIPTDFFDIGVRSLALAAQQRGWTHEQLGAQVMAELKNTPQGLTRRDTLALLAGLGIAALAPHARIVEEALPYHEANLLTAWKLARGSDLLLARAIVETGLPSLTELAKNDSPQQGIAAALVSKSYLLNGLISMHLGSMQERESNCLQAVRYAEIADEPDLIAASYRWLACTYYYQQEPGKALTTYQKAARYTDTITPLLRSSVLVETAVVQAQQGEHQDALRSLGSAQETFFVESSQDQDQDNLYIGHDLGVLTLWTGLTYYEAGNYQKALETYLELDGMNPKHPVSERIRLQILNNQALTSLKVNDLERACTYIEEAAKGAITLGSRLRFNEAQQVYQIMNFIHPNEGRVQRLKPLLSQQL